MGVLCSPAFTGPNSHQKRTSAEIKLGLSSHSLCYQANMSQPVKVMPYFMSPKQERGGGAAGVYICLCWVDVSNRGFHNKIIFSALTLYYKLQESSQWLAETLRVQSRSVVTGKAK